MKIIINADDFGMSGEINESIIDLHTNGCLTSVSVVPGGKSIEAAVDYIRHHKSLGAGVHLTLDGNYNMTALPSTVINPENGRFFSKYDALNHLKLFRFNQKDIYREYCLQLESILDHHINITHLDHHHHLHLYFPSLNQTIRVAKKYKIKFIRSQNIILHTSAGMVKRVYRLLHQRYLSFFHHTINGFFELSNSELEPDLDLAAYRFRKLLSYNISAVEIIVHPWSNDHFESFFFKSNKIKALLKNHELLNYGNL